MSWDKTRSLMDSYTERTLAEQTENRRSSWISTPYGSYAEMLSELDSSDDNQAYQAMLTAEGDQNVTDGKEHRLNFVVAARRSFRRQFTARSTNVPRRPADARRFAAQETAFQHMIVDRMRQLDDERAREVTGG